VASKQPPTLDDPEPLGEYSAVDEIHVGDHSAAENAAVDEDEDKDEVLEYKMDSDIEAVDEDEDCKVDSDSKTAEEDDDSDCKVDSDGTAIDSQSFHSHLAGVLNWRRGLTVSDHRR
jgi:hypothetical protein